MIKLISQIIELMGYSFGDTLIKNFPEHRVWYGKVVNNILFHLYLGASRKTNPEPVIRGGYFFDLNSYCDLRNYFLDDHTGLEKLMRQTLWLDDGNYLDIGANNGYTCYLADKYDAEEIYAFEPEKVAYERLITNANENWHCYDMGLSIIDRWDNLSISTNDGANSLNPGFVEIQDNEYTHSQQVPLKRFDQLSINCDFKLCKIDVEGHELEVLYGMGDKLRNVEYFYIETSDINFGCLCELMSKKGYQQIDGPTEKPGTERVANLTFKRI